MIVFKKVSRKDSQEKKTQRPQRTKSLRPLRNPLRLSVKTSFSLSQNAI